MPVIAIREKEYTYDAQAVIDFAEGLVGLPEMRRAVLIEMDDYEPFMWLASLENNNDRFIVVDPFKIYDSYKPFVHEEPAPGEINTLAIVKISSDWRKTTVNLRAPIIIDNATNRGAQWVLTDSSYELAEGLPQG